MWPSTQKKCNADGVSHPILSDPPDRVKLLDRKEPQMRGYVEALEAVEQGLPEGVEATHEQIMAQLKKMTLGD